MFVESGMYVGNQIDLLFRNYAERGNRYTGVGGYTDEGFALLHAAQPGALAFFQASAANPDVQVVFSTDANAGSHGSNTEELVAYVEQGGQSPMNAVVAATSRAAESLGLEDQIGAIADRTRGRHHRPRRRPADRRRRPRTGGVRDARGEGLPERPRWRRLDVGLRLRVPVVAATPARTT